MAVVGLLMAAGCSTSSTDGSPSTPLTTPTQADTLTLTPTIPSNGSPAPRSSTEVIGLFDDLRPPAVPAAKVVPPIAPPSPFAAVPAGDVVLFDIGGRTATNFGKGSLPSFSPDGTKMMWVSDSGSSGAVGGSIRGDVRLMDFSDGLTKTLATGRAPRFLGVGRLTYFADGNNKIALDLRTGETAPTNAAEDDREHFERLDAARSTTSDGFRITVSPDPKATNLPRGGASSQIVKVVESRTGVIVRQFTAFAAVPAGRGTIAVAALARADRVNIFLVQIATGRRSSSARRDSTRQTFPSSPTIHE